jgi:hypothetical protein
MQQLHELCEPFVLWVRSNNNCYLAGIMAVPPHQRMVLHVHVGQQCLQRGMNFFLGPSQGSGWCLLLGGLLAALGPVLLI